MHHLPAPFANLQKCLSELALKTGLQLLLFWKGDMSQLCPLSALNPEIS